MSRVILSLAAIAFLLLVTTVPARAEFEIVVSFGRDVPPGNVAVGPDGRIFMSLHGFYGPTYRVVEVAKDGSVQPYPNETWARAPDGDGPGLNQVLGLRADRRGILWMLDDGVDGEAGRVVGWDTRTESLYRIIYLPEPVTRDTRFLNDLAVDREHEAIYITDTASPELAALIVVDLGTGRARRVLEGSPFTRPEDIDMVIDGRVIVLGDNPARIGANPITVDPTHTWVYFAPMSGTKMYRVRTTDLLDEELSEAELEARVETYGDKPISDGSTIDGAGNVYITAITEDAVGVVRADGGYETLFSRDDLSWPDGFAFGPDGMIYATVNELHRSPPLNGGEDGSQGEFKIIRFQPLATGASGR